MSKRKGATREKEKDLLHPVSSTEEYFYRTAPKNWKTLYAIKGYHRNYIFLKSCV